MQILAISTALNLVFVSVFLLGAVDSKSLVDSVRSIVIAGSSSQSDHLEFDWSNYEDPARPEFWDNSTPPRPLRYLAANPTVENARRVKQWLDLQFKTMAEVAKVLGEGGIEQKVDLLSDVQSNKPMYTSVLPGDLEKIGPEKLKNIKVVNIYSSKCHACRQAKDIMDKLADLGAEIVHLQTDYKDGKPLYKASQGYTEEFRENFPHKVTPTLYIKGGNSDTEMIEQFVPFKPLYAHLSKLNGGKTNAAN